MLTGELRNQIDRLWDAFWSGVISNPLDVIEQITYLLFLRRLDELQQLEENKANRLGTPIERRFYPEGKDPKGRSYSDLRWSRFKHMAPAEMYGVISEHVFPFVQFNGFEVLDNPGKVSAEVAKRLAEEQFEKLRVKRHKAFESDFEREVKRIERGNQP
jgi:hypothetical protein